MTAVPHQTGKEQVYRRESRDDAQGQVGSQDSVTGMARRSSDREAIEAEIDRVRSLGLDALRTRAWKQMFEQLCDDADARFLAT